MPVTLYVFDAYGTLFDVAGAARAAAEPGSALAALWPRLAEDWRRKQLEYTWLRRIMGQHADFASVTADALDWAMEAAGLPDPTLRARLLALYQTLPAYPEVPATLAALRARGLRTAILSNGTPGMLAAATASAGIEGLLDDVLSVEAIGAYKPDPQVYALVGQRFGVAPDQVRFVSSNGWDVAGAGAFGFRTVWVNRAGQPVDRLPHRPDLALPDLSTLPDLSGQA
ncbi:haloacid dehalogenase type II [Fertoebacter nigrum]|uniref:(S)-2-haloacid dehalogenase n=1 Tax=Fertoeibacter niger TaxID=2656921 RepID=A0A8X8H9E6_9RHOB|nr:haloacid dehalogenase type II [Fertoeibacter niger]NUB46081.1 haloacid dehalogenase type II [Fertoeibacter niger]